MIKVLVVEDDPMVGKLHEHYLTQIKGFQAEDGIRDIGVTGVQTCALPI